MNRNELQKTMRALTWRAVMLREDVSADIEALSFANVERVGLAGFEGFAFDLGGARMLCAAPRRRNPGKKQTCTVYSMDDVSAYADASAAICAGDYAAASDMCGRISAASLRNEIADGLERLESELGADSVAAMMEEPQQVDELEAVRLMLGDPRDVAITRKRAGCCIWASGNTLPHRDALKALGFRWSPKRAAWYWRPCAA